VLAGRQMTMAAFPSQEHRPLKKMRFGSVGPDVYLQDKKQKEVMCSVALSLLSFIVIVIASLYLIPAT